MSDETAPKTPPLTTLYRSVVTPPDSGSSIDNPILIYDSDDLDDSSMEVLRGPLRQLADNSPSPSPRPADKLKPKKTRRHDRDSSLSGDDNVEMRDDIEHVEESDLATIENASHNTPRSSPEPSSDIPNDSASPRDHDTVAIPATPPSPVAGPLPIWKLEMKIKDIILKDATKTELENEGQAYIYGDPKNEAGYFKVGRSKTAMRRVQGLQKCKHYTFELIDVVPRERKIRGFGRLESLAQAELTNMKYSFDCKCFTVHREYFTGQNHEALEIVASWFSWLKHNPYDEAFRLSPFWTDRLDLLGGDAFSHLRCPSAQCHSNEDIGGSSCQACLRIRLKAWIYVTDFDYFKYECRMRVGRESIRKAMYWMWPYFGDRMLILIDGWENIEFLVNFLLAPTTHLKLLSALVLWCLYSVPAACNVYCFIYCAIAYSRIMSGLGKRADGPQLTKNPTCPRRPRKKALGTLISPGPEIEPAAEKETPDKQEHRSRNCLVNNEPIDINIPGGYSTPNSQEMSEIPYV
ncbi:GIY-YIG nuclease family protein [Aspergillus tanneri]|uniref:Bacteriophage T5 Orf172 DNA-binding domain-containing protein n=1 Tax=Aspergillus tanneri TaxID=1220188 RepID=A0A5M9MDQ1_9EURO|nr:uncharacterized protein ATNIH1004_009283 [Aspergillus tanneri]KAA8645071.1 hypothetical protein ATNIH1004_009283 [Aspergillus tanneri]